MMLAMLVVAGTSYADDAKSKSTQASSKARIVTPIALENIDNQGLEFGLISIGGSDSRIAISATSTVAPNVLSGNAVVVASPPQKAAKFKVSGGADVTYSITLPESTTMSHGANILTISNYTCSNGAGGIIGVNDVFYIGAELLVPAHSVPGPYQGTFLVTVTYD